MKKKKEILASFCLNHHRKSYQGSGMRWLLQIWVKVSATPTQCQCRDTSRVLLENNRSSLLRRQLMLSLGLYSRVRCRLVTQSCLTLLWPFVARQAPLSMGFSRQQYWSGLPFPSPRDLPDLQQGLNPHHLFGRWIFTARQPGNPLLQAYW